MLINHKEVIFLRISGGDVSYSMKLRKEPKQRRTQKLVYFFYISIIWSHYQESVNEFSAVVVESDQYCFNFQNTFVHYGEHYGILVLLDFVIKY